MAVLELPTLIDLPSKLTPIVTEFDNYRYFVAEGGRGGGKSHAIARWLLYLAEKYSLRIVCGRETQNTINESVYSLMADLVIKFNLNFEVQSQKLIHKETGTEITFRGLGNKAPLIFKGWKVLILFGLTNLKL